MAAIQLKAAARKAPVPNLSFEQAGRLGYIGTSYGALRLAGAGPGTVGLIDGVTGTLGVAATVLCLAFGVARILGTGRNEELLQRVKALAPDRIEVLRLGDKPSGEWAKTLTDGEGADFVISALGASAELAHSSIRFSLHRFSTEEEVDHVAAKTIDVVKRLRDMSPLYELAKEGVDLKSIQWKAD